MGDNIKGKSFSQEDLKSSFSGYVCGQKLANRILLNLLVVLLFSVTGFFTGFLGSLLGVQNFQIGPRRLEYILASASSFIFLTTIVWRNFTNAVVITSLSFLIMLVITRYLATFYVGVTLSENYEFAALLVFLLVIIIIIVSMSTGSLAKALIEVLYNKSNLTKLISILSISSSAILSSCFSLAIGLLDGKTSNNRFKTLPLNVILITIISGLVLGVVVTYCCFFITNFNRRQSHTFFNKLAIAIGSWGGTSFYSLDLSSINFAGTKLANTDLRAQKLYRTCFQGVVGLGRARVDNQYLDLDYPKVQKLLTHSCSPDPNFCKFNLQGAYLQNADMRGFNLTDTNLTGADIKGADLRGSILIRTQLAGADFQGVDLRKNVLIDANLTEANLQEADLRECILVRAQVARADFSGADLTGVCIEDWSVSSKTNFTDVRCDYVFRKYENGQPTHRYPSDRNFEPGEFAALFQQPENELELIFKGDFSYSALSLAFDKLKTEKPELDMELKGIEQRSNLWVVRVTSNNPTVEAELEQQFSTVYQTATNSDSVETTIKDSIYRDYEDIKQRWAESQQLVRQLTGISESQAEALKQLSQQTFGTNFFISGSEITNLTGQGKIEYSEAAGQIRSLVTRRGTETQVIQGSQQVLTQLQDVAATPQMQSELIQQILVKEAQSDPTFKRFLLQQHQQILTALPPGEIASAIQGAIAQLTSESSGNVV